MAQPHEHEPDPAGKLPRLPDATIEEVEEDLQADDWDPGFPIGELERQLPQHRRVDSRAWLLLPDRYLVRPLRGIAAAKASDALIASPHGRAFVALAARLRRQRQAMLEICLGERDLVALGEDAVAARVDASMADFAEAAVEEFLGEAAASGVGVAADAWARGWLSACDARRVPLPSLRHAPDPDPGGLVLAAKGAGAWERYYEGRYVHLQRLAACCAWHSIGPFSFDLRPSP